jgi:hypothetical protein
MEQRLDDSLGFLETATRLKDFLREQGHNTLELCWIFRDDFYVSRGVPIVRWPLPAQNGTLARQHFEIARHRNHRVQLAAVFRNAKRSFCCVASPRAEAGGRAGVEIAIHEPFPEARLEPRPLLWSILCLLPAYRSHQTRERFVPERRITHI